MVFIHSVYQPHIHKMSYKQINSLHNTYMNFELTQWSNNPCRCLDRTRGFREAQALGFKDNRHMKLLRFKAYKQQH
jgi:hypothetical protein